MIPVEKSIVNFLEENNVLSIHLLKDNSEMSLAPEFFFVSIETF
jgi:hypothetical protein